MHGPARARPVSEAGAARAPRLLAAREALMDALAAERLARERSMNPWQKTAPWRWEREVLKQPRVAAVVRLAWEREPIDVPALRDAPMRSWEWTLAVDGAPTAPPLDAGPHATSSILESPEEAMRRADLAAVQALDGLAERAQKAANALREEGRR